MPAEAELCAWSLGAFPPEVVTNWRVLPMEALGHCCMHSWASFGLLHTANAVLASLCFPGTFLVHSRPDRCNGARSLTFAVLAYFTSWISFMPLCQCTWPTRPLCRWAPARFVPWASWSPSTRPSATCCCGSWKATPPSSSWEGFLAMPEGEVAAGVDRRLSKN